METKRKPKNTDNNNNKNVNTNNNVNNNIVNNHIILPETLIKSSEKKSNWFLKAITGGIITISVSLAIYYGKQNMNEKDKPNMTLQNDLQPVTGTKQAKN